MNDNRTSQLFTLQDGRQLGFAEYGVPDGKPIFYFHGFPSSRLDWQLFNDEKMLAGLNIRMIAPDRPGYGLSSFKRGRKMVDWPEDVLALADHLRIEEFSVLGISGGGPYAAACASRIGHRLRKAGIVSGMGPADAPGMKDGVSWSIPGKPWIVRSLILKLTAMGLTKDPDQFLTKSKETMSALDSQLLDQPDLAARFIDGLREAFSQGTGGANQDAGLYKRSWGFDLGDIQAEIHLWHGGQDLNVPLSVGKYMAGAIPNCRATFLEDEGHFTVAYSRLAEIMSVFVD